jgi:adenylate cyclase
MGLNSMPGRKLIAVVYADMVGYSRLIGLDDAGTLERLKALRKNLIDPEIDEHGGRLVQTGGDSLLIVFDSIDGAVRCAVKVQQQVPNHDAGQPDDRAIRFRIGINIGDAIADGTDLHGDAVNVAARLQAECPPGGICVTRPVRDHIRDRLDLAFEELGALNLKNIARPVETFVLQLDRSAPTATGYSDRSSARDAIVTLPLPDKPSIAVLPFQNMSGDPEQDYFADGVVEDITAALSRTGWLFVIARNSSFAYKGTSPDIRKVGRELGVRYVLEGSIRRAGGRVRIAAQLIDATTGGHVWTERFEDPDTDLFALQDRITEQVVGALEPGLQKAEIARATGKPTENLDAYDLYLRALQQFHLLTESSIHAARLLLRQAITMDGRFGRAKGLAAACVMHAVAVGWIAWDGTEAVEGAALAHSAIADSPDDPTALQFAALAVAYLGHDLNAAQEAVDQALVLNGNSAGVLGTSGWVHFFLGDFDVARNHFACAIRLSPLDPRLHVSQAGLAMSLSFGQSAELEPALDLAEKVLHRAPSYYPALQARIEALVMMGRIAEAKEAAGSLISFYPHFSISAWRLRAPHRPAIIDRHVQIYRAAGIPE